MTKLVLSDLISVFGVSMRFSEARQGRVFVLRLEDGEIIHETVEKFAREKGIEAAAVIVLGGADRGSRLVVGPEDGRAEKIRPMGTVLGDVHEMTGTGTIFRDEDGTPKLHMHISTGRNENSITGCVRNGVKVWLIAEIIIFELVGSSATRKLDRSTGFELLDP
jgi:predicted DNA-binding protein with PD1-like motif